MAYAYFAEIYDEVMACVDYPRWAEYVLNLCRDFEFPTEPWLNLACGTGSLEAELIERGVEEIVSADASADMLTVAERKFAGDEVRPEFVHAPMQDFDLGRTFPLITCLYDSVNYLLTEEDVRGMLRCALRHLRPGGGFIYDVTTEYNIIQHFSDYTFSEEHDDYSYIWDNSYSIERKIIMSHVTIFAREKGDLFRKHEEDHYQRIYPTAELRKWSREEGFEELGVYSEFTRKSPLPRSDRVHFVLRKPESAS